MLRRVAIGSNRRKAQSLRQGLQNARSIVASDSNGPIIQVFKARLPCGLGSVQGLTPRVTGSPDWWFR